MPRPAQPQAGRSHSLTLPCAPVVVPQVRGLLGDLLLAWGLPRGHELAYDLRLIASELIANVIEHASDSAPDLTVLLELSDTPPDDISGELPGEPSGATLSFGVRDGHPFLPEPRDGADCPDDTSGRGRLIVRTLAAEAGGTTQVERHPDGKTLWVRLPWPGAQPGA
ncbi:ATP-binding protein [Yinghuangia sp. YIM S09857]|uniref:ATP-binding protein n=1 Tax=Yinghuangia sp. YIM S09857 TaxID=3436929 RepID=UPI003F52E63E